MKRERRVGAHVVVRVRIDGRWYELGKVGRKACDNLMLERVQ